MWVLFHNTAGNSDYTAEKHRMIHDKWTGNDLDRSGCGQAEVLSCYLPRWNEEKLWKSQDSWWPTQGLNHTSPEYNTYSDPTVNVTICLDFHEIKIQDVTSVCLYFKTMYTCTNKILIHFGHIHGTLIHVISTVHDTWLDGSPLAWAYFRSSPVTRSQGVPCNGDSICSIFLPVIKEQCNMNIH